MSGTGRRAAGALGLAFHRTRLGIAGCLALALAAGGCANAPGPAPMASVSTERGASIAFESIDGPPVAVFQTLVTTLSAEAQARQVQVVSRTGNPSYRIRGYLAALVVGGKSHISWVWDVYDANKQRVLRIAGEEAGRPGSNAWSAADDQMVRRIARSSIDRLAGFLAAPSAPPAVEPVQPGSPAIAAADADAPALALAAPR